MRSGFASHKGIASVQESSSVRRSAWKSLQTASSSRSSHSLTNPKREVLQTSPTDSKADMNHAQTEHVSEHAMKTAQAVDEPKKTQQQQDDQLSVKMASISGDGGEAGIELEDGKPVALKRSVKNNMFRYI